MLAVMDALGLTASADVLVASDHGFTTNTAGVDVGRELVEAGLRPRPTPPTWCWPAAGRRWGCTSKAVSASVSPQSRASPSRASGAAWYSRRAGRPATRGERWRDVRPRGDSHGKPRDGGLGRSPDLVLTFPWGSRPNAFGVPGSDLAHVSGGAAPYFSDHGSMSPWNIRNAGLAWGASFKRGVTVRTPTGNVDLAPTILSLLGIEGGSGLDGRVLAEAMEGGPDPERTVAETRVHLVEASGYSAALQATTLGRHRYVDKSWRIS